MMMKQIFLLMLLLPLFVSGQSIPLSYVNSSTGLASPEWEGGNSELAFGDINLDGHIDFVSVGDHGSPYINSGQHGIMVYFGDGYGNWTVHMEGNFGYGGVAVGDVNNDGFPDVGYGIHHDYSSNDFGDQLMEVALGNGTGMNWQPWDDGLATNGETYGMFGCDFADIDNDGYLDFGSISFGCCAGVHVYRNNTDGSWTQTFGFIGGNSNLRFVFGDINNDGFADFITTSQFGAVYFGDGTGDFTNATGNLPSPGNYGYDGVSLGDVNNNGAKDIAFVWNGNLHVYTWDKTTETWLDLSGNLPSGGGYQATQLYDMNADGFTDLAAFGGGTFTLWLGDGAGGWTQETQFTTSGISSCKAFTVGGDVDNNGYADIILVAQGGSWPSYQNHLRCYKEASPADSLWIRGLFPKGKEVFYHHSVQFIDWASEVPAGQPSYVSIEVSFSGNNGPWTTLADSLPNNGRCQWTVPNFGSDLCYLRFTVTSGQESHTFLSAEAFEIIGDAILIADFTASPTLGEAPTEVQFTDLSSGNILSWEWDFDNDGVTDSYLQNPVFTYQEPGLYSAALTISNGATDTTLVKEEYITALHPPSALFSGNPLAGPAPLEVAFTCNNPGSNNYWAWDFDNDGTIDSHDENPVTIYPDPGIYSVKLTTSNGLSFDSLLVENYIDVVLLTTPEISGQVKAPGITVLPNPSDGKASISLSLDRQTQGSLNIFDARGALLHTFGGMRLFTRGIHRFDLPSHMQNKNRGPAGIYWCVFVSGELTVAEKILILD